MDTIYHLLDVPAEKARFLRNAISTAAGFSGWWTTKTEQLAPDMLRFNFPGNYHKDFKVIKQDANQFEYECIDATPEWKGTRFSFNLMEDNGKIIIHFRHSGWKDQTPMFGICNFHWALYMKSIKDLVETGTGNPTKV